MDADRLGRYSRAISPHIDIMMCIHQNAVRFHTSRLMRTTIDIPERDHRLFRSLAHAQNTSLSKLVVELARRGLEAPGRVEEAPGAYNAWSREQPEQTDE
mgnify:CR=1 FL=1